MEVIDTINVYHAYTQTLLRCYIIIRLRRNVEDTAGRHATEGHAEEARPHVPLPCRKLNDPHPPSPLSQDPCLIEIYCCGCEFIVISSLLLIKTRLVTNGRKRASSRPWERDGSVMLTLSRIRGECCPVGGGVYVITGNL